MGCAGCGDGGSITSKAVLASIMMQVVTDFVGMLLDVWTSTSNREYRNGPISGAGGDGLLVFCWSRFGLQNQNKRIQTCGTIPFSDDANK